MSKGINIDWLRVVGEIIMITISILLAFELDQWNDRRNQREAITQYREGLVEDLRSDRQAVDKIRDFQAKRQATMQALREDPELFLKDSIYHLMTDNHTFYPKTGTYYTLKSTGDLRMINNHILHRRLSNLYEYMYQRNDVLADYSDDMVLSHQQVWHEAFLRGGSLKELTVRLTLQRIITEELAISNEYSEWLGQIHDSIEELLPTLE